jgi:hypothetical protein
VNAALEYKLPRVFYFDHVSRDLPEQGATRVVSETKRDVTVSMDAAAYDDLLSDAEHYATPDQFGAEFFGLVSSARATARRLREQGRPPVEPEPIRYMTDDEDRELYGPVENLS